MKVNIVSRKTLHQQSIPTKEIQRPVRVSPRKNSITLICADDIHPELGLKAFNRCLQSFRFDAALFFTSQQIDSPYAIKCDPIRSIPDYNRIIIKEAVKHVKTSHVMVCQWDGFILKPDAWTNDFFGFDYIGAPWIKHGGIVGNGGFSFRSKKLMDVLATDEFQSYIHDPEDEFICITHRGTLESKHGIKFAPPDIAKRFSVENTVHSTSLGFHGILTKLKSDEPLRPVLFTHSGDMGDIIYSLPTIRALGGGTLILTPDNRAGMKLRRECNLDFFNELKPLLTLQPYIHSVAHCGQSPTFVDYDLNQFRYHFKIGFKEDKENLASLHLMTFGVSKHHCNEPWLSIDYPIVIPDRPVVVNRTLRYRNATFPWKDVCSKYRGRMVFVGSEDEYQDFTRNYGWIDYHRTPTILDLARIVAGCQLFIGNQSLPNALAIGFGKAHVQECDQEHTNTIFDRPNGWYCVDGATILPDL